LYWTNTDTVSVLLIPTTAKIMDDFLSGKISESKLLQRTEPNQQYDSIYLCLATTLPEARGKGHTKELCLEAIQKICEDYPIKFLFVWAFTKEGEVLAETLSTVTGLPLKKLENKNLNKN